MSDSSYVIITGTLEEKVEPKVGKSGKPYARFVIEQQSKWGYRDKDEKGDPPPLRRWCMTFSQTCIKKLAEYEAGDEISVEGDEEIEARIGKSGKPWVGTTIKVESVADKQVETPVKADDDELPFRNRPEEGR